MFRRFLIKWVPAPQALRRHKLIRAFGRWSDESQLWRLSRHNAPKGFGIGLYCAMLPIPGQFFVAASLAILFRAHLPTSCTLIFITNPLTIPPIFFGAYKLGAWLLGTRFIAVEFHASWSWFTQNIEEIWLPLFIGSQILGLAIGGLGYLLLDFLWGNAIKRKWRARHAHTHE